MYMVEEHPEAIPSMEDLSGVRDLCTLPELSDSSLLACLKQRQRHDRIHVRSFTLRYPPVPRSCMHACSKYRGTGCILLGS